MKKKTNIFPLFSEITYKKPFRFTLLIIMVCFLYFIGNGFYENVRMQNEIKKFMDDSKFEREEVIDGKLVKLYKVSRETSEEKKAFYIQDDYLYVGDHGDILLSKGSPFPNIPLLSETWQFFFGGHAGMVVNYDEKLENIGYSQYIIEVNGKDENSNVKMTSNDWFESSETIGVRLKGNTSAYAKTLISKIGMPYNYSYIFNTKESFYCTDLITSAIYETDHTKINDGLIVSVNDIYLSKETYLFYYHYTEGNTKYIYYL